jgi:Histidine kinase-, DNA gyrase B-, and HSP90-like ATPase
VIPEVLALAHRELTEHGIEVRTELPKTLPRVSGDRVQLQQVFLNLIINGLEAMSGVEVDRCLLTIRGQRDELHGKRAVRISVEDLGHGVSPNDMAHLFEAFYTTKPHGMGIGLRISSSIVEAHLAAVYGLRRISVPASHFRARSRLKLQGCHDAGRTAVIPRRGAISVRQLRDRNGPPRCKDGLSSKIGLRHNSDKLLAELVTSRTATLCSILEFPTQRNLDGTYQSLFADGFAQEIRRSGLHRLLLSVGRVRGDKYDGKTVPGFRALP